MCTQIDELRDNILKERKWGHTTFQLTPRTVAVDDNVSTLNFLDAFVETLGFAGLGDDWTVIDRRSAQAIAQLILHRDLAYKIEAMSAQRACQLTEQFLVLFEDGTQYYTNGEFDANGLRMWSGISDATFDTGIVCIDTKHIGILWVQDED